MLDREARKFIEENLDKLSLEDIAKKLGLRRKKLKREIKKLHLKLIKKPPRPPTIAYKPASVRLKNRKKIIGIALIIFFATILVYLNTLGNDFIWDDEYLILNNSQIKSFSHFRNVFKTYVGFGSENVNNFYRPLQELSNMIDYFLWGEDPMGFHLTNILLHASCAVLVFIFIFYLCDNPVIAGLSGLFFGIHAIQTQAVAYIAGRADSLYTLFFLLSFIFFIRFTNHRIKNDKKPLLFFLSVIFFICSILSKEISLVFPLLVILYLYIVLKGRIAAGAFGKLKHLWVPYAAIVAVYAFLRYTVLNFFKAAPTTALSTVPLANRILTFFKAVLEYMRLLVFPAGLHMERTIGVAKSIFEPASFIALLAVLAILAGGIIFYRRNRLICFFIFWFFINLLPVSNIYPINAFIAEHWLYVPSIGYFFVASLATYTLYIKIKNNPIGRIAIILSVCALLFLYSFLTVRRNRDWKDEITFFENTLYYSPKNTRLYLNFGNTYFEKKEFDKAITQYKKAISIRKDYAEAYGNIGGAYIAKQNLPEAEKYLKKAVEIKFNYPIAHHALGLAYYNSGKTEEAIEELKISIEQLPQHYPALNLLGEIYLKQGNNKEAAALFGRSLRIMPDQGRIRTLLESAGG